MVRLLAEWVIAGRDIGAIPEPMRTAMNMVDAHVYSETLFYQPRVGSEETPGEPMPPPDSRSFGTIINPYGTIQGYARYLPELFEILRIFPPALVGDFAQKLVDVYGKYLVRDHEREGDWMFTTTRPVLKEVARRAIFEGLLACQLDDIFLEDPNRSLYRGNEVVDSFLAQSMKLLDRVSK